MHAAIVRRVILPLHERLRGRDTLACLRGFMRTQDVSLDALRALQTTRLRALLIHARARCPAWRERIDAAEIDPARATPDDLAALPTLSKSDLRYDGDGPGPFCDPTIPGGLHRYTTGGSSGDPLVFYIDRRRQAADQAARARSRRWFGVDLGQREMYLWGAPVELTGQDRLKQWRDRLSNHHLVSAFDMNAESMDRYLDTLDRYNPVHLFGYPSSIARLVRHAESRGRFARPRALKAVFVTGEVLMPQDRDAIGAYFDVPVADGYGSREAGFIAHECPAGGMHVTAESVIVELLDERGRPVAPGATGEITVTHLDAWGMPFIRYRTGDLSRFETTVCPCGMAHPMIAPIEGRRGDAIRTPSGGFAHPLSVIYALRECRHVREFRVVQRGDLHLDVSIVPAPSFDESHRMQLSADVARRFEGRLGVTIRTVAAIPAEPSGKHRVVRSFAGDRET